MLPKNKLMAVPAALALGLGVALSGAATASAHGHEVDLGDTKEIHDGGVTIAYTVEELEPSDDTVLNVPIEGELWEASVTVKAVHGTVTPVIPFFNARSECGKNYRVLYQGIGDEALSGATLAEGQEAEGNIYFDVTGPKPSKVVYADAVQDLLVWE